MHCGRPSCRNSLPSVTSLTDSSVTVHSFAPVPSPPTVLSLQEVIDSFEDHTMWDRFSFDEDGSWLLHALLNGTLIIVHDGSYMPQLTSQACSCGFVLYCSSTDKRAIGSFAEESDNADNYRGEWLGSIGALQVLLAVISTTSVSLDAIPPVQAHCDNMGVINHNHNLTRSLPEKQAQADLIRLCREYRRRLGFSIEYHHVKGHLDKVLRWDQLTRVQRENCLVDSVARTALLDAFLDDTYISSIFPHEQVVVKVDGKRVTGSPSTAIGRAWGYKVARELFHSRKIVDRKHFRLIYWDGVESCMKTFPTMFRVWVTKHVSHFCGTNRQLSRIDPTVSNTCPSCGCINEDTSHVVRCPSPGRTAFYNDSVSDLIEWLKEADTDPQLVYMIEEFLSGRGDVKVASLFAHDLPIYGFLASLMDEVGFDSFVEGRILTVLVDFQFAHYQEIPTLWTVERWAKGLIQRLLGLTHRQWLYRNAVVHFKGPDGYTHAEHERILSKMQDFLWVDPQDLLPRDRGLLNENFESLGSSPAACELWIAAMEVAISAAEHARRQDDPSSHRRRVTTGPDYAPRTVEIVPIVDTEGSIRYKRRRRRKKD